MLIPASPARFVSYLRVSTDRQGKSGLGLEAQRIAVSQHLASLCPRAALVAEYVEVESGKRNDRPQLLTAMERAGLTGATLIIAKLDRLSRNASFLISLRDRGVEFVACDLPNANRLTVGIMALVAEQERELISSRTKAALSAAKVRGTKLGNPNGARHLARLGNDAAMAAKAQRADAFAGRIAGELRKARAKGIASASGIARTFNEQGILTRRGRRWSAMAVQRVQRRLSEEKSSPPSG